MNIVQFLRCVCCSDTSPPWGSQCQIKAAVFAWKSVLPRCSLGRANSVHVQLHHYPFELYRGSQELQEISLQNVSMFAIFHTSVASGLREQRTEVCARFVKPVVPRCTVASGKCYRGFRRAANTRNCSVKLTDSRIRFVGLSALY